MYFKVFLKIFSNVIWKVKTDFSHLYYHKNSCCHFEEFQSNNVLPPPPPKKKKKLKNVKKIFQKIENVVISKSLYK